MKCNYIVLDIFSKKSDGLLQLVSIDIKFETSDIEKSVPMKRRHYTDSILKMKCVCIIQKWIKNTFWEMVFKSLKWFLYFCYISIKLLNHIDERISFNI